MYSRRTVLAVGLSIASGGCIADNTGPSSDRGGSAAPWGIEDSAMDIGVENDMNSIIHATVEVEKYRKEFEVDSGIAWVSENIIESGSTPTVTLTVDDNRQKEVKWGGEDENELYLLFSVGPEEITYRMAEKGTINRTQYTESEGQ